MHLCIVHSVLEKFRQKTLPLFIALLITLFAYLCTRVVGAILFQEQHFGRTKMLVLVNARRPSELHFIRTRTKQFFLLFNFISKTRLGWLQEILNQKKHHAVVCTIIKQQKR